MPGMIKKIYLK